jgi:hypothetical protein
VEPPSLQGAATRPAGPASHGRYHHSILSQKRTELTVIDCHSVGIHTGSDLAFMAVIFCQNDSVARCQDRPPAWTGGAQEGFVPFDMEGARGTRREL